MANHISHASLPYPIRGARYSLLIPYIANTGVPTDPTTPDTEISLDNGAFADCAEEVAVATGSNGMGYITLSGAETSAYLVALAAKAASGPVATLATLYPRNLPVVESGTAQAGAAGSITLAAGAAAFNLTGCFVRTTGGTGGGGAGGANNQARRIMAYNRTSKVATIAPNWETNPSSDTTYEILLPEGMLLNMLWALNPVVLGNAVDVETGGTVGIDLANVNNPGSTRLPANVLQINGTTVIGNGSSTPWGPA